MEVKQEAEKEEELRKKIQEYERQIERLKAADSTSGNNKEADIEESDTLPATPEEIAALRGERVASASAARAAPKGGAKATAKAKAAKSKPRHKPPREDEVDPNASQAEEEPEPTPKPSHPRKGNGGKKKKKPSTPEESMETPIMSPPPKKTGEGPVPRRLSFKAPDPVQSRQIDALQEDNEKLRMELLAAKAALSGEPTACVPGKPKRPPNPKAKPASSKPKVAAEPDREAGDVSESEEEHPSEAAKKQRLRRLCERKGRGKLHVPEEIHEMWLKGGHTRDQLLELLEESNWDKDTFVSKVFRSKEKVSRKTAKKKRGWYTIEGMRTKLLWSKSYTAGVVKFCEKKGNESLVKKDKYNKNLKKYYVEVDEEDEDMDMEEEKEREEHTMDARCLKSFQPTMNRGKLEQLPDSPAASASGDSDKEAKEAFGPPQEYTNLTKLGDSLLTRSTKVSDLIGNLESEMAAKPDSPDAARGRKSVQGLESATEILEKEYEVIQALKVEVSAMKSFKSKELTEEMKSMLNKVDRQVKATTVACSKVTTAETNARNILKKMKSSNQ